MSSEIKKKIIRTGDKIMDAFGETHTVQYAVDKDKQLSLESKVSEITGVIVSRCNEKADFIDVKNFTFC